MLNTKNTFTVNMFMFMKVWYFSNILIINNQKIFEEIKVTDKYRSNVGVFLNQGILSIGIKE